MSRPHEDKPSSDLFNELTRHLPPSASVLRVWALDDLTGLFFREQAARAGRFEITGGTAPTAPVDAVAGYRDGMPAADALALYLQALRPGGRLILLVAAETDDVNLTAERGQTLEQAGFVRVLAEPVYGVMVVRGEKPHTTGDTLARVRVAADADDTAHTYTPFEATAYNGRFVFLLTQSAAKRRPWETDTGANAGADADLTAIAIASMNDEGRSPVALGFSSLPKAVAFMQPMILAGRITGVNKIAKFTRETAAAWPFAAWLNPPATALEGNTLTTVRVSASSAVTGDE